MARIQLLLLVLTTLSLPFPKSPAHAQQPSPGEIILQAIRSIEEGDSASLTEWRRRMDPGRPPTGPFRAPEMWEAALGLAAAAWVTYRYAEAEDLLASLLQDSGPTDPVTPFALILRGEIEASQARLAEADSLFAQAGGLAEELGLSRARAWALTRLANVRGRITGDPGMSGRLLATVETLLDAEDSFLRGQFHCVRAGNDPSGIWTTEADARAGLELAVDAGIRRLHAACLHVLASDQLRRGRTTEALATFREEQDEQKAIGDRSGRAATLQWAGFVLFTVGDFATSRAYLMEAVSEGEASGNLSPVAWAYLSLSGIAVGLGDLAGGEEYLDKAQRLLEEQGDQWGLATLRGRRASVALAAGDWATAKEILDQTLEEHSRTGNVLGVLGTQTGLLELALAKGELDTAEQVLAETRQTARDSGMGSWEVSFFFHEAEIALKRGDTDRAREALDRFLQPGQFSIRTYRAQMRYAEVLSLEGRFSEAAQVMESSLHALEEWRSGLDEVGLQRYAFQMGEYLPDPDLGVASLLASMSQAGLVEEAFDLAERQRARHLFERMVLAEIGRRRTVEDPGANNHLTPPPRPLRAQQVLMAIPDSTTAIIEFVTGRGGEPTTAFILTQGRIEAENLPPVDSLTRDINLLRSLAESGGDVEALAVRLGEVLMGPMLRHLPESVSQLVLIPSGALHRIPFDLLEPSAEGPLLTGFDVSVVPSASVLSKLWEKPNGMSPSFLVLGNPTLPEAAPTSLGTSGPHRSDAPGEDSAELGQAQPTAPNGERRGMARLPGASREARTVARYGQPSHLLTGDDASERFLKTAPLEGFGVIHLATHAVVDDASVTGIYLILAAGGGEDGLLFPGDIARMSLNSDLVVLSACRTAGGTVVRGEGVQGLTAPFLQAGARTVLATQWPMEDRSGHHLIRDFYGELAKGARVGQALRAAKMASLDRGDPASVWAAFTVVGDGNVRVAAVTPPWWFGGWLWITGLHPGLLILVLAGAGLMAVLRRRTGRS